jgi:hypothetical protein
MVNKRRVVALAVLTGDGSSGAGAKPDAWRQVHKRLFVNEAQIFIGSSQIGE